MRSPSVRHVRYRDRGIWPQLFGHATVASARGQAGQLTELVSGVLAVQLLLGIVVALAAGAAGFLVPAFQEQPLLLSAGLAFAILQGFNPVWYFLWETRELAEALEITPAEVANLRKRLYRAVRAFLTGKRP